MITPLAQSSQLLSPSVPTVPSGSADETNIRDAARQFESFLLKQMLRELRASALAEPQSGSATAYREMADDLMADHLAKSGAFGFGKAMADQMLSQIRQASLKVQP